MFCRSRATRDPAVCQRPVLLRTLCRHLNFRRVLNDARFVSSGSTVFCALGGKPLNVFHLRLLDKPKAAKRFSVMVSDGVNILAIVVTRSVQAVGDGFIGLYTYTTGYNRRHQHDYSIPVWTSSLSSTR